MKEKRYMTIIKSLLLAAASLAFFACSNLSGGNSSESSSDNNSSDKAQTITITGNISISEEFKESGALPAEYLFLLNQINDSNERSAFPSYPSNPPQENYYATATATGKPTVPGTVTKNGSDVSFTMAIRVDNTPTTWTIEAGLKDTFNESLVTILNATFSKSFSNTDPSFSEDFILKPLTTGSGNIDLTINYETSDANTPDALELYLDGASEPVSTGTGETISLEKITLKNRPTGTYKARLVFKKNGYVVFTDYQGITVFPNLTTNTWVYSKSGIYTPINSSGVYKLTDALVEDYLITQIYVGNVTIGSTTISGKDDKGNGTIFAPFATFAKAITFLKENGKEDKDYTIWISGVHTGPFTIQDETSPENPVNVQSLTISGYKDNTTDKLKGGTSGSVLYLDTNVPVKIKNLTITGGKGTSVSSTLYGGGIYINKGSVELTTGVVVDGNTADVGGGVYLADGTLYLNDTAVVGKPLSALGANPTCAGTTSGTYANKATLTGGGISIEEGTLYLGYSSAATPAPVTTSGGVIYNLVTSSSGSCHGGGIDNNKGTINFAKGNVKYNFACGSGSTSADIGSGGGISTAYTFNLRGDAVISNNKAANGGGVYITTNSTNGNLVMSGGTVSSNNAVKQPETNGYGGNGGGVNIETSATLSMSGGEISSNEAASSGGAIYHNGTFEITKVAGGTTCTAMIPKGTDNKNNIQLASTDKKIKITGQTNHAGNGAIAVTPARWKRGDQIFADGSTASYFSKFTLTDSEWSIVSYTVGNNTTGRIDAPLYVARTTAQTISGVSYGAGNTSTNGALGTKAKPYSTIADAVSQCWNGPNDNAENTGRVINIVGTITGNQSISADYATTAKASAISLQGVTGSTPKLDGNNSGTVLSIAATDKDYKIIISNLTITRGNASGESDDAKNGGGINISKGSLYLGNDVSITANKAAEQGGGVYIGNQARLFMYGTSIIGDLTASQADGESTCANSAKYGGGVYSSGQLNIGYSGLDETNKPTGTALSGDYGIRRNYASEAGGGVYHKFSNGFHISSGNISYNYCAKTGGAVTLGSGSMNVNGGTFLLNKAGTDGGAIYMNDDVIVRIYDGNFYSNQAANNGGAVYDDNGYFSMYGGQIGANSKLNSVTSGEGGAIYENGRSCTFYQDAYLYTGTRRSNDLYLSSGKKINPVNTDGTPLSKTNVATITPSETDNGTAVLAGSYIDTNFTKFSITTANKYINSNGKIYGTQSVQSTTTFENGCTYAVCSKSDLVYLSSKVNGGQNCSGITFKLEDNISVPSGNCNVIGINPSAPFKGTFDGNKKAITFNNTSLTSGGTLFGLIGYAENATIKNLEVKGSVTFGNGQYYGCIVGMIKGGEITNCSSSVNFTLTSNFNLYLDVGGIVGTDDSSAQTIIDGCTYTGTFTFTNEAEDKGYCGGIIGEANYSVIRNCINKGNITGETSVGGIAGEITRGKSTIKNCGNIGTIKLKEGDGGIAGICGNTYGTAEETSIECCFSSGTVSKPNGTANGYGIVGSTCWTNNIFFYSGTASADKPSGSAGYTDASTNLTNMNTLNTTSPSTYKKWKVSGNGYEFDE